MDCKGKLIPVLPEKLKELIKKSQKCDIILYGDSGKRYHVNELYDMDFHENYNNTCRKKMGLPDNVRPLASLRKSLRILCMNNRQELCIYYPNACTKPDTTRINVSEFIRILEGKEQTLFLPGNKQKHIVAVAEYMYRNASNFNLVPEEMYTLGLLHDIGYLYGSTGHARSGAELLEKQGYKYWKEVMYHGKFQEEYESDALNLLNIADLMIDSNGCTAGVKQRLNDIKERYGAGSNNYIYSYRLVKNLKSKGLLH